MDILGELGDDVMDIAESRAVNDRTAELVVNGTLIEMKLSLYVKVGCQDIVPANLSFVHILYKNILLLLGSLSSIMMI